MRLALAALLAAFSGAVFSQSVPSARLEVVDRLLLQSGDYSFGAGALADIDRDGRPELVLASGAFDEHVHVVGAAAGFRIVDAPAVGGRVTFVAAIERNDALADAVVIGTRDGDVGIWRGSPLARVAGFRTTLPSEFGAVRAGNVDDDPADEVVMCAIDRVVVIDLASRRSTSFPLLAGCHDVELVEADGDAPREIAITAFYWQSVPPKLLDGATGHVLATAPHATGPNLMAGNVDADPLTEIVVSHSLQREGYVLADLAPAWTERQVGELPDVPQPYRLEALVDRDGDGRHDAVVRAESDRSVTLVALADGTATSMRAGPECVEYGHFFAADFVPAAGPEFACVIGDFASTAELDQALVLHALDGTRRGAVPRIPQLSTLALADTDGAGVAELVLGAVGPRAASSLRVFDADTFVERTRVDTSAIGSVPGQAVPVQADADAALEIAVASTDVAVFDVATGATLWIDRGLDAFRIAAADFDSGVHELVAIQRNAASCRVIALDAATGARRWETAEFGAGPEGQLPTLAVAPAAAGSVVVAGCRGELRAFRGADGVQLWQAETPAQPTDLDFIGSGTGTEVVLTLSDVGLVHRSLASGAPTHHFAGGANSTDAYRNGVHRVGLQHGDLVAVDVRSGAATSRLRIGRNFADVLAVRAAPQAAGASEIFAATEYGVARVLVREQPLLSPQRGGLTGVWYERGAAGQGFALEFLPGPLTTVFGGWFTFDDVERPGVSGQRWNSLYGNVFNGASAVRLETYRNVGGNFAAPPITNPAPAGEASLRFIDCNHAELDYRVDTDAQFVQRRGTIELERLTPDVACAAPASAADAADHALSGNWYDPASSGQGFVIEVNPRAPLVFLSWYTYAPQQQPAASRTQQRWFSGQTSYARGARTFTMPLYATSGSQFDAAPSPDLRTEQVGTAQLEFRSCASARIVYAFTAGENAGRAGAIELQRVGPVPAGCRD